MHTRAHACTRLRRYKLGNEVATANAGAVEQRERERRAREQGGLGALITRSSTASVLSTKSSQERVSKVAATRARGTPDPHTTMVGPISYRAPAA